MTKTTDIVGTSGGAVTAATGATPLITPAGEVRVTRTNGSTARSGRMRKLRSVIYRCIVPVVLVCLWQLAASFGWINTTLTSSPALVVKAAGDLIGSGELVREVLTSLKRCAQGLAIGLPVGLILGVAAGLTRLGEELLDSTMQALRTIPFVSLIPLFILWFGIGDVSKIALVAFGATFPIYLNTYAGIRDVDLKLIEAARSFGLNKWQLITKVVLPGAMPSILVGLRFALGLAVIALVVSETVNANSGIGALVSNARQFLLTDIVMVGILVYAILGLAGDFLVRVLEKRLLAWRKAVV